MDLTPLTQFLYNPYIKAAVIFIGFFIISKLIVFISEKVILQFTKKTKTKVDDLIVERTNGPVSLLLIFIGARLALIALGLEEAFHNIIGNVISSFIIIIAVFIGVRIVDILIDEWGRKYASKTKSTIDDHIVNIVHKSTKVAYFIIVLLMILNTWGIKIGPLLASLGIAGIAVAFALQSTLGNIFGGISMILDKNIEVGDVIILDPETKGTVLDIGLRSTKMRTFDNEVVIIPNGKLSDSKIQNIAQPEPPSRVVIPFGVAYGSKIDKVKKVVLKEIAKIEGLQKEPEPMVRFLEMSDSALLFKAYFYVDHYSKRFPAIDQANTLIYNALKKNKISIPFPQMDVHLKKR